ncbi:hypothetical protein G3480_12960 [Thiorhodococcus mannitoliphagus]|uniref:Uncharacterized protein n=1 Tax=Thiorhodococcus mannitoliphagus TaxID=329406 RepID=A0A6P1DVJ1_9GAMM|nr:hypothetical protein [Thiorhodococcus mannitoliphagus]NEX21213.1 hypothetical protein [Thiorhodococcus mannitoliphagus]
MAVFSDLYLDYQQEHWGTQLLWPVWTWTLHVPERRRDGLNVLAFTVLRLHAAGCDDPDWIADHLGVDGELIRYIVGAELIANGLLDQKKRLTQLGTKQLERSGEGSLQQRAALLFQSAESGALWPRQRGSLREIEPIDLGARYPSFLADRASGQTLWPFVLSPANRDLPPRPSIAEFRDALRQDRIARRHQRLRGSGGRDPDDLPSDAIELIDPRPRPAWVLCRVYKGPTDEHPWLVSDPLGQTRAAEWMRKEVFEASRRLRALARRLGGLLGEPDEKEDWETYRRREDEQVRFEVFERFPAADQIPGLEDRLVELLRVRATVAAAGSHKRTEEVGNLIIQCQRTLEQCFLWLLTRWPLERPGDRLSRQMRAADLQQALGCAVPALSKRFIEGMRVQPSKVYGALRHGTGSLRQYLAGVLLSLLDHPRHPFGQVAPDEDLMLRLLALSQDRDAAGHGGNQHTDPPDRQLALRHADTALDIVERLIEGILEDGQEQTRSERRQPAESQQAAGANRAS